MLANSGADLNVIFAILPVPPFPSMLGGTGFTKTGKRPFGDTGRPDIARGLIQAQGKPHGTSGLPIPTYESWLCRLGPTARPGVSLLSDTCRI
jgi:hypothetical protein